MTAALATAGATSVANAAIVEISLSGNTLTSSTNNLLADFSGDGNDDFTLSGTNQVHNPPTPGFSAPGFFSPGPNGRPSTGTYFPGTWVPGSPGSYSAKLSVDGVSASGRNFVSSYGSTLSNTSNIAGSPATDGLIAITFTDANYGGFISGWLDVSVSGANPAVTLQRIIWDDANLTLRPASASATASAYATASPVPEPSGLALLALGAGGLIARRRRNAT